jgi:hypothetical protein
MPFPVAARSKATVTLHPYLADILQWRTLPTSAEKKIKDERCRRTPGWNEVPFAIYYVLNNRHNDIN